MEVRQKIKSRLRLPGYFSCCMLGAYAINTVCVGLTALLVNLLVTSQSHHLHMLTLLSLMWLA